MLDVNICEAEKALTEKHMYATTVERFLILDELKSSYKELPQPLRFSKIFSIMLSRVSTPIESHDLIAGRSVDRELTDEEEEKFQAFLRSSDYPSKNIFWSSGHCTYSWEMLAKEGIVGLRRKALDKLKCEEKTDKQIFLRAIIEVYDAITEFILRYANEAEKKGLHELARNLRMAATERPTSFAPTLQLLWVVTFINCAYISENPTLTVGRLDQILYPLYVSDIKKGILTKEKAAEYIIDYYCKHNLIMGRGEHQLGDETNSTTFSRILNFDAPQYLLIAGVDDKGVLAVNELTEMFAECIVPSFKNPVVIVRYVKDMDKSCKKLWDTLIEKSLNSSSLIIYNDNNVYSLFRGIGLPEKDARKYAHFGCNWCSPGDNAAWMSSAPKSRHLRNDMTEEQKKRTSDLVMRVNCEHGLPEDLMVVLHELVDRNAENITIDDIYNGLLTRFSDYVDRKLAFLSNELALRKINPSGAITFGDCFLEGSLNTAECFSVSSKYHFQAQGHTMFGTLVDSIIAIDQLVMIEKRVTFSELVRAVDANFEGYPEILAMCRNADKYGMDTPLSNMHTKRLSTAISDIVIEKDRPYFEREGLFLVPCMQSDTWHLKLGQAYSATPDGRLAYTSYSQNSKPTNGACVNGLTAMFNSMLNIPHDGYASGALNLDIDASQFSGENGRKIFGAMLATYFNNGGLNVQVTSADVSDMIDAQKNPHLHRDLRVRVTGYSGIFVDISERLQNDIIKRHL